MKLSIWSLKTDCNRDLVLRTDLDYFSDHFVGKSLIANWNSPSIEIVGKRKRLRDFVSWMLTAPVVSQKAKDALGEPLAGCAEFLPLIVLRGTQYWAINVTKLASCVDFARSRVLYAPDDPTRIISLSPVQLVESRAPDAPMFKLQEHPSEVFVRRAFVDIVIQNGLRGAVFADPAADPFRAILRGESQNVVPGIPE